MAKRIIRDDKDAVLKRARRVAGQARAVTEMLEADVYCVDVLTQIAATRAALLSLARVVLSDHMRSCVADAFKGGDADEAIEEIDTVLSHFVK